MQLVKQPLTKIILELLQQTAKPLLDIPHHKTVNPDTAGNQAQEENPVMKGRIFFQNYSMGLKSK